MTIVEVREMGRLRADIRRGITLLVDESIIEQVYDDGTRQQCACPSLIAQLRLSIFENKASGHSNGSGRKRKVPIDVEAYDLYRAIDREWGIPGMSLENAFRTIPRKAAVWADLCGLGHLVQSLTDVADMIRAVIDPPRRYHVAAACPVCGVRMVLRPSVYGDLVQGPALVVDGVTGCTCLSCGQRWPPAQLEHLALVLGLPPVAA